ncbi:energy transducer TonB [Alkalitalea saponilacus]|uniref:TonB family C-terminal domain-containing protein n=1 Tax=Alkalitalea saponilacus TaxID=889453 RepID=A0A1T5HUC3_9BACT|nr:energy transducer TonB [Alkalitalea saponilacus]ASB50365.1 hypothetical protein CDL62_15035 [Alkalitalea saponilacus]SKC24282.1 TonB family C-terminal domain-containing protein [Alkalitalea saponilacus]
MKRNFLLFAILLLFISIKAQGLKVFYPSDNCQINDEPQKEIETFLTKSSRGEPSVSFANQSSGEVKSIVPNQKMNQELEIIGVNSQKAIVPIYKEPQIFLINNFADTIIICAEGTRIKIPKESFAIPEELVSNGNVELKVTEYYKLNDIIKANLTTTSYGLTLETGGILYVEAFVNGKRCQLAPNKKLGLCFKNIAPYESMQIFSGEKKSEINWIDSSYASGIIVVGAESFTGVEQVSIFEYMPEFRGGVEGLRFFLRKNTKYPIQAYEAQVQGKVIVRFDVELCGSVQNIRIVRGVSPSLDYEAYRVVKSMPNWSTALSRGKFPPVAYTIPIVFQLPYLEGNEVVKIDSTNRIMTYEEMGRLIDYDTSLIAPASTKEKENMTDYYLWTSKMYWINCGRWINYNNNKNIFVSVSSKYETIIAVFNNKRSIVAAQMLDSKNMTRSFLGLPQDQEIIVIGIRQDANGVFLGVVKEKANNQHIEINYQKVEELDFKELLDEI